MAAPPAVGRDRNRRRVGGCDGAPGLRGDAGLVAETDDERVEPRRFRLDDRAGQRGGLALRPLRILDEDDAGRDEVLERDGAGYDGQHGQAGGRERVEGVDDDGMPGDLGAELVLGAGEARPSACGEEDPGGGHGSWSHFPTRAGDAGRR
jgi:hypothetical protein